METMWIAMGSLARAAKRRDPEPQSRGHPNEYPRLSSRLPRHQGRDEPSVELRQLRLGGRHISEHQVARSQNGP